MGIGVSDENLILLVEMMIQPPRSLISAGVVGNHAAVVLKLVYEEGAKRICSRIERQCSTEDRCTSRRRKIRCRIWSRQAKFLCYSGADGPAQTRHQSGVSLSCQPGKDSNLVILRVALRAEDGRVRQQRHGILRVLAQPFERRKQKCFVFLNRKSDGAAELLPAQRVFHIRALRVGQPGIKRLARLQRLADSERVCGIQRVIAEKTKKASMQLVGPRLRDDINDRSASTAQLGRIII